MTSTTPSWYQLLVFAMPGFFHAQRRSICCLVQDPGGEGTAIIHLADGRISGGDSFFTYSGSYEIEDDRFTAELTTIRHAAGPPSLFGLDISSSS